jgi:signal transduction histidine kinase
LVAVAGVLRASLDLGERRGRFASAVTHELRTPLTTFRLYTQMLADGMVVDPKARQDYLRTLETESERLTRVVESVLLHSRLEDGGVAGSHEVVGIRELLQQVEPSLRARSEASGQTLCVTCDVVPVPLVRVDVQSVEQILFNLTDNVGKYARGAADPRVHLSAGLRGRMVQLRLRDHGPGIPEDVRRHAFQPYRRGREHEGGPAQGVGLGLSVARGLARSLGGDLSLDPDVKEGAGFILSLPRWRP